MRGSIGASSGGIRDINRIAIKEEVQTALSEQKPVVALESTIISHGFPYPDNLQMANDVEQIIRDQGCIPATIAVLDGKIRVGLSEDELYRIATDSTVIKTSIRDLPKILATGEVGATTVASTSFIAEAVGISFFATGGLGGVHRDASVTFDVSADLPVLAKTNLCVVCAGVKSILDIPGTLEYLETLGVPVYGYETDRFPGFYIRDTGHPIDSINKDELVRTMLAKEQLNLPGAIVVAVPIPIHAELDQTEFEQILQEAMIRAKQEGIQGKHITPYLLGAIKSISNGKTVAANLALIKNNATLAATLASAYSEYKKQFPICE